MNYLAKIGKFRDKFVFRDLRNYPEDYIENEPVYFYDSCEDLNDLVRLT